MTKYFYLKVKKWEFDRDFFWGVIILQLDRGQAAQLYDTCKCQGTNPDDGNKKIKQHKIIMIFLKNLVILG